MSHYVLYVSLGRSDQESLSWQQDLTSRGIVLLRAGNLREAVCCCRAYHLMMIFLELDEMGESSVHESVETLVNASTGHRPPVVGVTRGSLPEEEVRALATAGMVDIMLQGDPDHFILWRLEILTALDDLRRFEQARMDVSELANKTRLHLHELSQPLSAVQGRLQLLAARCPTGDPNEKTYQDLVRLIFEVTHQVMEIQQLHRQFS